MNGHRDFRNLRHWLPFYGYFKVKVYQDRPETFDILENRMGIEINKLFVVKRIDLRVDVGQFGHGQC